MENLLTLDEITLIPNDFNEGATRNKINYFVAEQKDLTVPSSYPIFTSPLEAIIDPGNYEFWQSSGIRPIIPRTESLEVRLRTCMYVFTAFTLNETKQNLKKKKKVGGNCQYHVCIDTGNGHYTAIFDLGYELKKMYGNQMLLMGGPIYNIKTYEYYSKSGFDFVRVGSKSDSILINQALNPFRYPMGSLLEGIKQYKLHAGIGLRPAKIVADGEIDNYADILKALALGADYVMIGQEFSRIVEAAGTVLKRMRNPNTGEYGYEEVDPQLLKDCAGYKAKLNGYVRYYYMNQEIEKQALKEGFSNVPDWKNKLNKTFNPGWETVDIDVNLQEWIEDFQNATRNAFMLSNSSDWESYHKNIKYGSINII